MKGRIYRLYGCRIESQLPLFASAFHGPHHSPHVRILETKDDGFFSPLNSRLSRNKVRYRPFPDGSVQIHFFHSHVCRIAPDGKTVFFKALLPVKHRSFPNASRVFAHFVRNNILSFCLLKFGIESLHGSAVVVGEKVVGLIGQSAYGKSSLAAAFLQAGYPVFSDDLLAIRESRGGFQAAPGVAHLKLYREAARAFLPAAIRGIPMNPIAKKKIYPLPARYTESRLLPMGALYVLHPRYLKRTSAKIRVRSFAHREAVINLIRATHNLVVQDPARIRKQFLFASALASRVPVRAISYPRDFKRIPELRDSLIRDAERHLQRGTSSHKRQKAKLRTEKALAG